MNESLEKAEHDLAFALDDSREALRKASAVEAIVLLPIIERVSEAWNEVTALIAAQISDTANAPDQARLQPSPEAGCSVCHTKLDHHHNDPRPHHCLLPAGHEGRHFCHICGLYWDSSNDQAHFSEVSDSERRIK